MMIMPATHSSPIIHYWAGRFPGSIGWIVGPIGLAKTKLREWMPYALDNDAYTCWARGIQWNEKAWLSMLEKVAKFTTPPLWALVPDSVANRDKTLENWDKYHSIIKGYGWKLAFAVQDDMLPIDVPSEAEIIFVGGTTPWKWKTVEMWATSFPYVHVGRVNEVDKLLLCNNLGIKSVDGSGWFRATENGRQATALKKWIES